MALRQPKRFLIPLGTLFLVLFVLGPVLWMGVVSLADNPDFLLTGSFRLTIHHYRTVLTSRSLHFLRYYLNSAIVAGSTALIVIVLTTLAAYAVTRISFPGRRMTPLVLLAVSMFPQICIVGYLYKMFAATNLLNTYAVLLLPYCAMTLPLGLWIIMSYLSRIPSELDQAARVDGAGRLQTLLYIITPLALPGIFSAGLLVFIAGFNEFLFAVLLTVDFRARTLPVGIALFEGVHGEIPWGNLMAASTLTCLPLVGVTLVFQRFIVQGLTRGAVKG